MNKRMAMLWLLWFMSLSVSVSWAGGIRGKSNLSAEYFRSLTRNAAFDAADAIAYNPAGVMRMENGFYVKADALFVNKVYTNDISNAPFPGTADKYETDYPSTVPGLFAVYKQDRWAGFFAVTVPGGGGTVKYEEGNVTTLGLGAVVHASLIGMGVPGGAPLISDMELEGSSVEMGYTLGAAYKIDKVFSIAGGIRYVDAKMELDARVTNSNGTTITQTTQVELERTGTGLGYFIGINAAPTSQLNLGLLYQSNTELDVEADVSKGNTIAAALGLGDGTKLRRDLPGLIGFGISYELNPHIRLETAYTQYLESSAELEESKYDNAGDSSDLAFSITYILDSRWQFSLGYMHTNIEGMEPEDLSPELPELDADTIGIGAVYSPTDRWRFTLGYTDVRYDSVSATTAIGKVDYEKRVNATSLGVQYRF